jgi:hypothetical protein
LITFDDARAIVAANRGSEYPPEAEFQVATWGWENSSEYQLVSGPYVMVYGHRNDADLEFLYTADGPWTTVDKLTGEHTEHWGLNEEGLPFELPDATPVGTRQLAP